MQQQKVLFLLCLSTELYHERIVVCPDTPWQRLVAPFYVIAARMVSSLAFAHHALYGLVCGIWYHDLKLFQVGLQVFGRLMFFFRTNLWRLLHLNFLCHTQQGRFFQFHASEFFFISWSHYKTVESGVPRSLDMALYFLMPLCLLIIAFLMSPGLLCLHHCDKGIGNKSWLF